MTTSHITGHTKNSLWDVFEQHSHLLKVFGEGPELSDSTLQDAEVFVWKLYGAMTADNISAVNLSMTIKRLPPTRDDLCFLIQRVYFQILVWRQAHLP